MFAAGLVPVGVGVGLWRLRIVAERRWAARYRLKVQSRMRRVDGILSPNEVRRTAYRTQPAFQ